MYKTVGALSFTDISSSTYYYIPCNILEFNDKIVPYDSYQTLRAPYHTPRLKGYWKYMYEPNLRCRVMYKTVGALSFTDISSSTYCYYCAIASNSMTKEHHIKRHELHITRHVSEGYWKYMYEPPMRRDVQNGGRAFIYWYIVLYILLLTVQYPRI